MGNLYSAIKRSLARVLHLELEAAQPHLVDYLNKLTRGLCSLVNFVVRCTDYGVTGVLFGIRWPLQNSIRGFLSLPLSHFQLWQIPDDFLCL